MHASRTDGDRVVGQRVRQAVALAAVSDAVDDHRVDVEPEPERQHNPTVTPRAGRVDRNDPRLATSRAKEEAGAS